MPLRPRQTRIEIFSTFLTFESDHATTWITDPKLRRSIQAQPTIPLEDCAHQWLDRWKTTAPQPAQDHLSAYLQESCYWATQKTMPRIASPTYGLADCFQMAIAQVPKILAAFTPHQGASLATYSRVAFSNGLRDSLRRVREIDICSDWSLLLKTSRKRLESALRQAGLGPETITQYITAWTCFETAYLQSTPAHVRQRQAPDRALWKTVAQLYNQATPSKSSPDTTPETIERWLTNCAKQTRTALYPNVTSLNVARSQEMQGEMQDDLPASLPDTVLEGLILEEEQADRQAQRQQVYEVLNQALAQLDDTASELVKLYYRDNFTQQQMAQQLGIQQYTVSRRLTKARTELLIKLTQWSQATLHISPSSNVVKHISAVLEEWLQDYYRTRTES